MNPSNLLTTLLTILLGGGGLAGLVTLFRLRVDKGAIVVETVSRGVLVLERLNDRLELDLAEERAQRTSAEALAARYYLQLVQAGQVPNP